MELNKQFTITYYSNKDKKHITSKVGDSLITYFDMDKEQYRTAKGSWKVRL
jgi:hypothetical protein